MKNREMVTTTQRKKNHTDTHASRTLRQRHRKRENLVKPVSFYLRRWWHFAGSFSVVYDKKKLNVFFLSSWISFDHNHRSIVDSYTCFVVFFFFFLSCERRFMQQGWYLSVWFSISLQTYQYILRTHTNYSLHSIIQHISIDKLYQNSILSA